MRLFVAGLVLLASNSSGVGRPLEAVAFDLEPIELAQTHELKQLLGEQSKNLRRAFAEKGLALVDARSAAPDLVGDRQLSECDGCDVTIARRLGADVIVTTTVQEIQYPIYSLYATVRDAATGRVLRKAVANVEGLDGEDWERGVTTLVKERLLERPLPADAAALRELVARMPVPPE